MNAVYGNAPPGELWVAIARDACLHVGAPIALPAPKGGTACPVDARAGAFSSPSSR